MKILLLLASLVLLATAARGAALMPAPPAATPGAAPQTADPEPTPSREVVCGVIRDAVACRPLAGATIAVRTRKGQVVSWGKTGADGAYALEGRYAECVRLPAYREKERSLLGQIVRGAGSLVGLAARGAGFLVRPVARAAGSAVGGSLVGEVAAHVATSVMPPPEQHSLELPDPDGPAVFTAKVVCPGYRDYQGPVQAYWMDPPDPDDGGVLTFWLDPIALAPRDDSGKRPSGPHAEMMRLRRAALEPSIAARGAEVVVSASLEVPAPARGGVKVLARNAETRETVLLQPVKEQPGLFRARIKVGAGWPLNDQRIVLLALRAQSASPQGPRSAAPEELAEKLSLWKSRRLAFDPQILASRDREALTLTVVE